MSKWRNQQKDCVVETTGCIFKEAWHKVSGLKKPLWGGIAYLAFFTVIGNAIFKLGNHLVDYYYPVIDSENLATNTLTPLVILGILLVLRIAYSIMVILPMRFSLQIIPLRHIANKTMHANDVFRFFQWRAIARFLSLEALVVLFVGIPIGIAAGLFMAPDTLSFPFFARVTSYIAATVIALFSFYLAICFLFSYLIVVDRDIPAWQCIKLSYKTVKSHWFYVTGILIVAWLSLVLGLLCLVVGLIWAIPYVQNLYVIVYQRLIGIAGNDPVSKSGPTDALTPETAVHND